MVPGRFRSPQSRRRSGGLLVPARTTLRILACQPSLLLRPASIFLLNSFADMDTTRSSGLPGTWKNVESFPVLSQVKPGQIRSQLPDSAPPDPGEAGRHLRRPGPDHSPGDHSLAVSRFFAFFPGNNSAPSILGEVLSAALGVQGMMWVTSPACTELGDACSGLGGPHA